MHERSTAGFFRLFRTFSRLFFVFCLLFLAAGTLLAGRVRAATREWSAVAGLDGVRAAHSATLLLNGLVLVAGGKNASGFALATASLYNPSTGQWSSTGSMNGARSEHTATLLPNGKICCDEALGKISVSRCV